MDFKVIIERDEDGWYVVTVPSHPGCVSQGKSEEEAKKNIAEAIELHLSTNPVDKSRHDRMVVLVTQMLDLNKKLQEARL